MFPPVGLLGLAVRKIERELVDGIVVLPRACTAEVLGVLLWIAQNVGDLASHNALPALQPQSLEDGERKREGGQE